MVQGRSSRWLSWRWHEGRRCCSEPQMWFCAIEQLLPCLLQVRGIGGGSSLVIPGALGMLRGFAAAWCVLFATMGHSRGRAGWRSPLVSQCFPAVARHLCILPGSALNAPAVLANATLFLDVVDAGAYELACFAAPRIPGARCFLPVDPLSISCRELGKQCLKPIFQKKTPCGPPFGAC